MENRRLAVLFPGIGYHCDKPLLYYAAKLAGAAGYEVLRINYAGFPEKVRGDGEKLRQCVGIAWEQACAALSQVNWAAYGDILFIGKSIGTLVASRYALEKGLTARHVLLTPLTETFRFVTGTALAFHGTADPWADTAEIVAAAGEKGVPIHLTEGANHSLETGDILRDVRILTETVNRLHAFIQAE